MESNGFFCRVFGELINSLFNQIRYKITDIAESKIQETVEELFNQSAKTSQQTTSDRQERNTKS